MSRSSKKIFSPLYRPYPSKIIRLPSSSSAKRSTDPTFFSRAAYHAICPVCTTRIVFDDLNFCLVDIIRHYFSDECPAFNHLLISLPRNVLHHELFHSHRSYTDDRRARELMSDSLFYDRLPQTLEESRYKPLQPPIIGLLRPGDKERRSYYHSFIPSYFAEHMEDNVYLAAAGQVDPGVNPFSVREDWAMSTAADCTAVSLPPLFDMLIPAGPIFIDLSCEEEV